MSKEANDQADSNESDAMLPDCLHRGTEIAPLSCCGLLWPGTEGAICTEGSEALLQPNTVSGMAFGFYGWIPEDLKPETAWQHFHACVNNCGNWRFPSGLSGYCLRQLSTAQFQYDFKGLKELLSSACNS